MQDEQTHSNRPDFNALEQEILQYWDEHKTFEKSLEKTRSGQPFVFYDGPPFATGLPHYGSLLPSIIKDAIPRFQTMRGRFVRRKWGWDCHGLPIENIVEKKLGISGKKQIEEIGVDKFNQACRENVLTFAEEWGKIIRRIARWVDFDNSYKTMDTTYQESVWWALKQLWDKKLIYEDRKVLLYCARCETPISNFEVAMDNSYKDVTEDSVFVKFKLLPRQRILDFITDDTTFALAWTTTPWTLPGNTALNVGPEITYVIVRKSVGELRVTSYELPENQGNKYETYILAKNRLEILQGNYEVVREITARSLEEVQYEPLYALENRNQKAEIRGDISRTHRIYAEDYVTTEDGTGIVHNAAMYGEEDYAAAKRRGLPRFDMLDNKGKYLNSAPEFLRGKFIKAADKLVIEDLQNRGLVYRVLPFTHSYPHCHRCATPLYYLALPSWFINIQSIKNDLIKHNAEEVNWYPQHLKHGRFEKGLQNAPDWNISRNRYWATALPFWKCQAAGCDRVICVGSVQELVEKSINFFEVYPAANNESGIMNHGSGNLPTYQLTNLQLLDLHKPYIDQVILKCDKCGGEARRIPEVVDCWVESGSMPFAELHYPFENNADTSSLSRSQAVGGTGDTENFQQRFPADFVVEYIPQTRAWFYVMHVINSVLFGRAPFFNVATTGNILGTDGRKMSKSFGNYPDPGLILEKYGADALRFYLLSSPVIVGEDMNFDENGVRDAHQRVNMLLYNVWQFYKMYAAEGLRITDYGLRIEHVRNVLDRWILERLKQLTNNVTNYLENFNTVKACREIVEFISDLSTWYVRRSRERVKSYELRGTSFDNPQPATRNPQPGEALQILGYVLAKTCQILAPFCPFISERIYRDITGEESVHLSSWPALEVGGERLEVRGSHQISVDERVLGQMALVREMASAGLSARKAANVPVRQPLQKIAYRMRSEASLADDYATLLLEELNIKELDDFVSLVDLGQRKGGVARSADFTGNISEVALQTELNAELKAEGTAREMERVIQDLRKKAGLQPGDMVNLYYNIPDAAMQRILQAQVSRQKTFIADILNDPEVEPDEEAQVTIDGKPVWLGVVKV